MEIPAPFLLVPMPFRVFLTAHFEVVQTSCEMITYVSTTHTEPSGNKKTKFKKGWKDSFKLKITTSATGYAKISDAITRIFLAAIGTFVVVTCKFKLEPRLALVGCLLTCPSLMLAFGGFMIYSASLMTIQAIATGALGLFGKSLLVFALGWVSLEKHDILPYGLFESVIVRPISTAYVDGINRKTTKVLDKAMSEKNLRNAFMKAVKAKFKSIFSFQ